MAFDRRRQDAIFKKTDGQCHICRKTLARRNYGVLGARGAWEVEHSNPRAVGGTDHLNNLYPACLPCNRSKRHASTKSARGKHGFRAAQLSREKKAGNAWLAGLAGAMAGRMLLATLGPLGIAAGALIGAAIGSDYEPD
jgi:5-methylcytosine-specific restriction endonuclease McrA